MQAEPMLDERSYAQAQACVHCGLCLPVCPTYTETGLEADSPRGRIYLIKAMADGRVEATENVLQHLDLCLDCRACEPACPSDIAYHLLIERQRSASADDAAHRGRVMRWLTHGVFTRPWRMKLALIVPRLLQTVGLWDVATAVSSKLIPGSMGRMMKLLPGTGPIWPGALATRYPAQGERKMTVGLHTGCVGSVLDNETNRVAVALLRRMGCEVVVPRGQRCCGAIHHHGGDPQTAAQMAQRNARAFADCDAVVSCAGGCGAMLKEYDELLGEAGEAIANKTRDICELLASLDPPPPPHRLERTVVYHDSCHLAHAQGVVDPPRALLGMIEGLRVVELQEAGMCCGAAGTYNLTQPDMADTLAKRKLDDIVASGASVCVSGNIGCTMQIAAEAKRRGVELAVAHPVELLHEAYFGGTSPSQSSA